MLKITKSSSFIWSLATSMLFITAYIITWQYYAMWWFFIAFADLAVALIFLVVLIRCLIFMVLNRKIYRYVYLPFFINLTAIAVTLILPPLHSNKNYFKSETNMSNYTGSNCPCNMNLYIQYYCVYGGGATATDIDAVYLTDKKNFRIYLGKYNEGDEIIAIVCKGHQAEVTKTSTEYLDSRFSKPRVLESKTLNLDQLIKDHFFE